MAWLVSLAVASACGDDGSGPPRTVVVVGTYGLLEVNARSVPITLRLTNLQTGAEMTVAFTAGELVLEEDGAYTLTLVITPQNGSPTTRVDAGTYEESRGDLTLQSHSLDRDGVGRWSGNEITLTTPVDLDGNGSADSIVDLLLAR